MTSPWDNPKRVVALRELWAEGHSTAEIGRRINVSKNSVISKAHQLDLAPRPSPIEVRCAIRRGHKLVYNKKERAECDHFALVVAAEPVSYTPELPNGGGDPLVTAGPP